MSLQKDYHSQVRTLLSEVEQFISESGMTATGFGRVAHGDPGFVFDLRKGRNPTPRVIDDTRAFIIKERKRVAIVHNAN